jgi:uncharacterized MAPEG superfamily protein
MRLQSALQQTRPAAAYIFFTGEAIHHLTIAAPLPLLRSLVSVHRRTIACLRAPAVVGASTAYIFFIGEAIHYLTIAAPLPLLRSLVSPCTGAPSLVSVQFARHHGHNHRPGPPRRGTRSSPGAAPDAVRGRSRPPEAACQAQSRRLRREVGRAQDGHDQAGQHTSSMLGLVKPSSSRQQQRPTQERDSAAQARPSRLRWAMGRAQQDDHPIPSFIVILFTHVFFSRKQRQVDDDDEPRVVVCRSLGRAQEATPASGHHRAVGLGRRQEQYWQQPLPESEAFSSVVFFAECLLSGTRQKRLYRVPHSVKLGSRQRAPLPSAEHSTQDDTRQRGLSAKGRQRPSQS